MEGIANCCTVKLTNGLLLFQPSIRIGCKIPAQLANLSKLKSKSVHTFEMIFCFVKIYVLYNNIVILFCCYKHNIIIFIILFSLICNSLCCDYITALTKCNTLVDDRRRVRLGRRWWLDWTREDRQEDSRGGLSATSYIPLQSFCVLDGFLHLAIRSHSQCFRVNASTHNKIWLINVL